MSDLEAFLNGESEAGEVVAVSAAETSPGDDVDAEAGQGEAVEPQDNPEAKAETQEGAEPPKAKDTEEKSWTKSAVLDERRKRQELERKLAELEGKAGEAKRPDVFEDQNAAFEYVEQQVSSQVSNLRLEMSQEFARQKYDNYDELEAEFVELASKNPFLTTQLAEARNPAEFAAQTALKAREAKELQDVPSLKAKLEQELRAKLEAELRAEYEGKAQQKASKRDSLTPSLASSKSTGGVDTLADYSIENLLS